MKLPQWAAPHVRFGRFFVLFCFIKCWMLFLTQPQGDLCPGNELDEFVINLKYGTTIVIYLISFYFASQSEDSYVQYYMDSTFIHLVNSEPYYYNMGKFSCHCTGVSMHVAYLCKTTVQLILDCMEPTCSYHHSKGKCTLHTNPTAS